MTTTESERTGLVFRPHRVRIIVIPVAIALVVVFAVVAVFLKNSATGVRFDAADQISMVAIGIVLGLGSLVFVWPKVATDAEGVLVRNALFGHKVPWSLIRAVSFPDGQPWARLELPSDEYVPIVAIQAADGELAVTAIRELRALHRKYHDADQSADRKTGEEVA
jgi:hypothetical protein